MILKKKGKKFSRVDPSLFIDDIRHRCNDLFCFIGNYYFTSLKILSHVSLYLYLSLFTPSFLQQVFFFFFLHLALILALHGKKSVASCSKLEDQAEIIRGRNSDRPTLLRAKLLLRQKPSRKFSLSFIKISREIVRINVGFLSFSLLSHLCKGTNLSSVKIVQQVYNRGKNDKI